MLDGLRAIAMAMVVAVQIGQAPTRSDGVVVTAVFDGDTIAVSTIGRVRLLGIDAPEITHGLDTAAPFAREARMRLADLVLRRFVRLEYEGERIDMYGRRLAYVLTEDGTLINAVLLREGLARISARTSLARLDELRRAEAEAQTFRRGMWGTPPQIQPSQDDGAGPVIRIKRGATAKPRPAKPRSAAGPRKPRGAIVVKTVKKKKKPSASGQTTSSSLSRRPCASCRGPASFP